MFYYMSLRIISYDRNFKKSRLTAARLPTVERMESSFAAFCSLAAFLREQGIHLPVASAISALYQSHPEVLPPSSEWSRLAVLVVKLLAGYRLPQQVEGEANEEQEEAAKEEFFRETAEVSKMLPLVWGRSDDTDGVEECLKAFYVIISTEGTIALC